MTDTCGNEIYCECSTGEYNITVNGEPGGISSSGESQEVVRESSLVVGRGIGSTADYQLDVVYDGSSYEVSCSLYHDL
jgi:hypothetical protein